MTRSMMGVAWSTTVNYMRGSSIAGLSHAANSRSAARAVYWLVIFTFGLGFTIQSLHALVKDFLTHPVVISSYLTTKPDIPYPAVTICNMNRVHCSNLEAYLQMYLGARIEQDNFASESDKQEVMQTYNTLMEFTLKTGCRTQVCDIIASSMNGFRTGSEDDPLVVQLINTECHNYFTDSSYMGILCYRLRTMSDYDESLPEEVREWSWQQYNETVNCDMATMCEYFDGELWIDDRSDVQTGEKVGLLCEEYMKAKQEAAEAEAAEEESSRKKRRRRSVEPSDSGVTKYDESTFMMEYMALDESIRSKIGHQMYLDKDTAVGSKLTGMFLHCEFQGVNCSNTKYWHQTTTPTNGNCFTFNAEYNKEDDLAPRNSTLTGALNGLTMELFVDQLNYMVGELSQSAGVRVVVHNPDSYPMIEEFGLDVMPGTATSMSLQMSDIIRLPDPHPADCYESWEQTDLNRDLMNPVRPRYDKTVCTRYCLQHKILQECDCFNTQYDLTLINVTGFKYHSGEARPCDLAIGGADDQCMEKLLEAYDEETTCPTCHSACRETDYSTFITTASWPSNRFWTDFALDLGYDRTKVFDAFYNEKLKAEIQHNYLKVNIYFQTLNVREIEQTPKYSPDSSFAAVGGALSLFLGVAIILLFELVELSYDITYNIMWPNRT